MMNYPKSGNSKQPLEKTAATSGAPIDRLLVVPREISTSRYPTEPPLPGTSPSMATELPTILPSPRATTT
jgi:hypothetical protein